jgi:hypothetical protein
MFARRAAADPDRMLRKSLALVLMLGASLLAVQTARADSIARTTRGIVVGLNGKGISIMESGGIAFCSFRDQRGWDSARAFHLALGQRAIAICFSYDGGATWEASRLYPDQGNSATVSGMVWAISPTLVTLRALDDAVFQCSSPGRAAWLAVGRYASLTCVFKGQYELTAAKPLAKPKTVQTMTVTGEVNDLTEDELFLQNVDGAPRGLNYDFTVLAANHDAIAAVASTYGSRVTVTVRADGKRWVVTNAVAA